MTSRLKSEILVQLAAHLGRVCSTTPLAVLILWKDALGTCGCMGASLLEYFHVLLDMSQHGWAAWRLTQSHHILLQTHPTSQTSWKAGFAPSSRSLELLPVPLSSLSSKALIPVSELLLETWACQGTVVSPGWCWVTP